MALPDLTDYRVYVWPREKRKAVDTGSTLGSERLPASWTHDGKTYRFMTWLDYVDRIVVFSETDPEAAGVRRNREPGTPDTAPARYGAGSALRR